MKHSLGFVLVGLALAGCASEVQHHPPAAPPAREIALEGLPKAVPPRSRQSAPDCNGDTFAMVGTARWREGPHWVDCRTGERVEYSDAEFDAWFAAHHSPRASTTETR